MSDWEDRIISVEVWSENSTTNKERLNTTLWELGNRYIMSGREVATNHWLMSNNGTTDLTQNQFWNFIVDNGPYSLATAYDTMLDALVSRCTDAVAQVKTTLLILLVVEAIILVLSALAYIIILVKQVGTYRFHIFAIFLLVPSGLIRSLASRKVEIDGEQEEEEEEEEGGNTAVKKSGNRVRSAVSNIVVNMKKDKSGPDLKKHAQSPKSLLGWIKLAFKKLLTKIKVSECDLLSSHRSSL